MLKHCPGKAGVNKELEIVFFTLCDADIAISAVAFTS